MLPRLSLLAIGLLTCLIVGPVAGQTKTVPPSAMGTADAQVPPTPQISLALDCQGSRRMTATIRNAGTMDSAVIFGEVLANGGKYIVDGMTLQVVTSSDGAVRQGVYHPRRYPNGVAGRVDDWIVPLPMGASYTLTLDAADFVVEHKAGEHVIGQDDRMDELPRDARLSLRLPIRPPKARQNLDVTALAYFRVWTGVAVLVSNSIATSERCR